MTKSRHLNMPKGLSLAEKIEYHSIPEPNSGCKLWMGRVAGSGPYAIILHDGKHHKVSRIVCGALPGEEAMHKCDNTFCVEETHIVRGTHAANMRDASVKRRLFHKITPEQRQAIRQDTRPSVVIAQEYGLSLQYVRSIGSDQRRKNSRNVVINTPWGPMILKAAAAKAGIGWPTLRHRIHAGWDPALWFIPPELGGDRRSPSFKSKSVGG